MVVILPKKITKYFCELLFDYVFTTKFIRRRTSGDLEVLSGVVFVARSLLFTIACLKTLIAADHNALMNLVPKVRDVAVTVTGLRHGNGLFPKHLEKLFE